MTLATASSISRLREGRRAKECERERERERDRYPFEETFDDRHFWLTGNVRTSFEC